MFSAYPVEAVRGVINQHRANRSGEDPDMKGVRERLIAWREANPERVPESHRLDHKGPWRTMVERCERYDAGGPEAWRIDGWPARWWPAMQEAIQCWQETGDASMATVGLAIVGKRKDRPKRVARWREVYRKKQEHLQQAAARAVQVEAARLADEAYEADDGSDASNRVDDSEWKGGDC